jgi:uncharacterized coiled-coil DUF342 family protein
MRALLEIDRERTAATKLQKELDAARAASNQTADRQRSEMSALLEQLGDIRQKAGVLEGNLQAVTANRDLAINELKGVQAQLTEATAQVSLLRTEAESWRQKAEEF